MYFRNTDPNIAFSSLLLVHKKQQNSPPSSKYKYIEEECNTVQCYGNSDGWRKSKDADVQKGGTTW